MNILVEFHDALILSVLCCILWKIWKKRRSRSIIPTNWPVIGMLPTLLQNAGRIHEHVTEVLRHSGGTIEVKGPWFANMDMLLTCDPANINHILCKNFHNYPKGPYFQKIFGVLGDGIINVDSELWELHRKTTTPLMNHANFRSLLELNISQKIENGLLPVLHHYAQQGLHVDLQDIFRRVTFDISCLQFLDKDPDSLSVDPSGDHSFFKALRDAVNAILYRHILPEWCWKLQKWVFGVDREKKLAQAGEAFDHFLYPILLERTNQLLNNKSHEEEDSNFSVLTLHIKAHPGKSIQFLRDTFLTFIIAASDTTGSAITWFFWLLANNPLVESKILDDILQLKPNLAQQGKVFKVQEEFQKSVYLHAACCESLRLFPSVPLNHKIPLEKDILPSGHVVTPNTKIIMSFYSMGKMDAIWGSDCMEFKPERWISPNGGIKHQPPYKFPAFNAGPRTCMGRDMAFTVMKMVAASIICQYHCELVDDDDFHSFQIMDSILFEKKHGLKVKLIKRK